MGSTGGTLIAAGQAGQSKEKSNWPARHPLIESGKHLSNTGNELGNSGNVLFESGNLLGNSGNVLLGTGNVLGNTGK